MFNQIAMRAITCKARNEVLSRWEQLQEEIRYRAYHGYDFYFLYNSRDFEFIHALREFGFEVVFSEEEDTWCVKWDN